tara:strand:- start:1647 stop:3134 length:1488 start_codon:yes stop_codon:yes gene_type:complete
VPLKLTNTLSGKTEKFNSLVPGKATIYCCGVTVYDLCHLGHARSYIAWDILRRALIWEGYEVIFVQNFTDIDDKIINRATQEGCSMHEVSEKNITEFHKDMDALGILRPDRMPRATRSLNAIRSLIKILEEKGAAYSIDGDVYFAVEKCKNYGKLSKRNLDEQQINADGRIEEREDSKKQNSFDFALWKSSKQGEPSFPSPWGNGRPGWHIECSAMVKEELGETIDIHLGGCDLIFPHHENEIAQSEQANGKELARYWLHNGMVNVGGQKMSKSLGNFTTIRSLLETGVSAMTLRLFVLQAHYRKPLDFTSEGLQAASKGWEGLNSALSIGINHSNLLNWPNQELSTNQNYYQNKKNITNEFSELYQKFIDAINDDLNTSKALSVIFELARPLRSLANQIRRGAIVSKNELENKNHYSRWLILYELTNVLGLKAEIEETSYNIYEESEIELKIKERLLAKKEKDFSKADKIRQQLREQGIELIDKPNGRTEWIRN